MKIRERLERAAFKRDLARAQKTFAKVTKKAESLRIPKKESRSMIKLILRAAGFKKIRLKERN